jgi:hypothetical protein
MSGKVRLSIRVWETIRELSGGKAILQGTVPSSGSEVECGQPLSIEIDHWPHPSAASRHRTAAEMGQI